MSEERLHCQLTLLQELRDKGDLSEEMKADITLGIEAASAVLQRTNEAVHAEERNTATQELRERVEDWKGEYISFTPLLKTPPLADPKDKGHRLDSFGDLLQYGTYHVIKGGTSSGKDEEREVRLHCHH